ncbi:DinB family protein [soil metagenome]
MSIVDAKTELIASLETLNEAVLAKLDGLGEYDLRRPLTPTGTNMLGIVKHLASVQAGYFGDTFGRPWPEPLPWLAQDAEINDDMYATADETSDGIRTFYRRSWTHARETSAVTELDDTGTVPWWPPDRSHPSLRTVLLHMTVETARHAGHLDVVREMIDGKAGRFADDSSMPGDDEIDWPAYVAKVEAAARSAHRGLPSDPCSS